MSVAAEHQVQLAKELNISEHDHPIGAFGMCYNSAVLSFELLGFYYTFWQNMQVPQSKIEETKKENAERVIEITKWLFIHCMSCIEHNAKEFVKQDTRFNFSGRIYLKSIIKQSLNLGLISQNDYDIWTKIIFIRNSTVHNNSICENNETLTLPSLTIQMHTNQMLEGPLSVYLSLTEWIINAFYNWCKVTI